MGGIPKQVLEQDAEANELLEKQLAAERAGARFKLDATGEHPEVPEEPTPAPNQPEATDPEPTPEPQPEAEVPGDGGVLPTHERAVQQDEFPDERKAQNERLLYSRLERSASENRELKRQNAELAQRVEELSAEVESMKAAGGKPAEVKTPKLANREGIRELLRAKMGEDYSDKDLDAFADCVEAIVSVHTKGITDRMDAEKVAQAKARFDSFSRHISRTYPAFPEMDAKNDPRWVAFLNSQINPDVPGITYRQLVRDALAKQNYSEFERYVQVFGKKYGIDFSLPQGKGGVRQIEGQQVPKSLPPGQPARSRPAQVQFVPRSEIDSFRHSFIRKTAMRDYGMTADEVSAKLRFYEDAEAEGRVDETK